MRLGGRILRWLGVRLAHFAGSYQQALRYTANLGLKELYCENHHIRLLLRGHFCRFITES